jgi:hypothetical protein
MPLTQPHQNIQRPVWPAGDTTCVTSPMKVLLDTGVISSADFLEGDSRIQKLKWGSGSTRTTIAGFRRVDTVRDADQQNEKDALFTVGRLAREGRIALYAYSELNVEMWRRPRGRDPLLNAFLECRIMQCPAPVERSKFRATIDMNNWIAKGGKSDRDKGIRPSESSQIAFFQWLSNLPDEATAAFLNHSKLLGLDDFEVVSLQDLPWFQTLARAFVSPENLPDCFHLWTARRNGMHALLTLEKKLPRTIAQLKKRKQGAIDPGVAVLRPTELLRQLNVMEVIEAPVEPGRFYSCMEIFALQDRLLKGQLAKKKLAETHPFQQQKSCFLE